MARQVELRLTLGVRYTTAGTPIVDLRRMLESIAYSGINNGTLTGETAATVDEYDIEVVEVKRAKP